MNMEFHNKNECFLLFGEDLNKIIAMLEILKDKHPGVEDLHQFVENLKCLRSYDETLDQLIMGTRVQDMNVRDKQKKKGKTETGLTMNEILKSLDIRRWTDSDRKN